jgi:hypothetical protein
MKYFALVALAATLVAGAAGCGPTSLRVAPVTIQPIHMQIDVTLHDGDAVPTQPAQK